MAENVLFDPTKKAAPPVPPVTPVAAPVTPPPATTPAVAPPALGRGNKSWLQTAPPSATPPPPPPPTSSLGMLLKVGVGLVILLILLALGVFVVLPLFSKHSQVSGGKVTLNYWGIWEDKQIMQPLFDDFHKQYPNITVDYEQQDLKQLARDSQNYPKRLVSRVTAGDGPDLFRFHNTWYPMLSSVLAPLSSDVTTAKDFSSTYFPVVSSDLVKNGAVYGVPLGFDDLALFVNPDIFSGNAKVPVDWFDFEKAATSVTSKGSDGTITTSGAALGTLKNITHGADIMGLLFADSDVDPTNITKSPDTTSNAAKALVYFTRFTTSTTATWSDTLSPSIEMFAKGNLAMYIGYSWDIFSIKNLNPTLQFKIYSLPKLVTIHHTIASYWVEGVSLRSQHPQEAMLLMKYLNQKSTQQSFYANAAKIRGFGEPFARKDLADTLKSNPLIAPFEQQGPDAVSSIFMADTFDDGINGRSDTFLDNAVTETGSTGSADGAVNTLASGVKQVLGQYGH